VHQAAPLVESPRLLSPLSDQIHAFVTPKQTAFERTPNGVAERQRSGCVTQDANRPAKHSSSITRLQATTQQALAAQKHSLHKSTHAPSIPGASRVQPGKQYQQKTKRTQQPLVMCDVHPPESQLIAATATR
jgi:hypothetical protein